jgi:hypothetical protein
MEEGLGLDLGKFVRQFVAGTSRVDYAVRTLEYKSVPEEDSAVGKRYEISVTVARELDGILPQKISIGLNDGGVIDTTWDGSSRIAAFDFRADSRPEYVEIGSRGVCALDENAANNSLYIKGFGSRLLTFEWDLVFVLEFLLSLLT